MNILPRPSPSSPHCSALARAHATLLFLSLLGTGIGLHGQTVFVGGWNEYSGGQLSEETDWTDEPYWGTYEDGTRGHVRPGYALVSTVVVQEWEPFGLLGYYTTKTQYGWKEVISEPVTTHHTSNEWKETNAWSAGRPDGSTKAYITDSRTIVLPGVNDLAATARALTVFDAENTNDQFVTLRDGTLNLTPASVFDTSLKVGMASATGAGRYSELTLSGVTLTSSGFAEIGKGLPVGAGGGSLVGQMTLQDNSRWLHQAGLIEIGGGSGSGNLTVGSGSLLAGSLFPGSSPDPQVIVNNGGSLRIEVGGNGRLSEIRVNSMYGSGFSGLSVAGALETSRLTVGESGAGKAFFDESSTSSVGDVSIAHGNGSGNLAFEDANFRAQGAIVRANSVRVDDGSIALRASNSARGDLTIGTATSEAAQDRVFMLGEASVTTAALVVTGSDVTVHGRASLGHFGAATVNIENGGVFDIRGQATLGYSDSVSAGSGHATVTGAGSVLRAQNMEVGYSYFDTYSYNPYPSPSGSITISNGGRLEIAGRHESWDSPWGLWESNYGGELTIGKNGTLDLADGTAQVAFTDPSNGGTLNSSPQLVNYGTIRGGGTGPAGVAGIDFGATGGTLINKGTIDVGHSPGWLKVNGDVTFGGLFSFDGNGRLKIELGGTTAGFNYDVFEVMGNADFSGGTLELIFLDVYTPLAGDYWDFLRVSGDVTGWFSSFIIPQGYESYLTALQQGWPSEGSFRLYSQANGHGGGSSVPDSGTSAVLFAATCIGLILIRRLARARFA